MAERRERKIIQSKEFQADMVAKGSDFVRIWPDRSVCLQALDSERSKSGDEKRSIVKWKFRRKRILFRMTHIREGGLDFGVVRSCTC
jgi:hypothetical protein